jgi:hypothetical protein
MARKRKKSIKAQNVTIILLQALIDLIVGVILLIIDRLMK